MFIEKIEKKNTNQIFSQKFDVIIQYLLVRGQFRILSTYPEECMHITCVQRPINNNAEWPLNVTSLSIRNVYGYICYLSASAANWVVFMLPHYFTIKQVNPPSSELAFNNESIIFQLRRALPQELWYNQLEGGQIVCKQAGITSLVSLQSF